jgi:uncharacterized protein (DUF2141 family)
MRTSHLLLPLAVFLGAGSPQPPEAGSLHLTLEGLRSAKGTVRLCLWSAGAGYPDCRHAQGVRRMAVPASATVELDVEGLVPGQYAVSAIHDENDNQKLDKSFVGLPTEGVAFSNNARISFGPPKYDHARFTVSGASQQTMKMRYFL